MQDEPTITEVVVFDFKLHFFTFKLGLNRAVTLFQILFSKILTSDFVAVRRVLMFEVVLIFRLYWSAREQLASGVRANVNSIDIDDPRRRVSTYYRAMNGTIQGLASSGVRY